MKEEGEALLHQFFSDSYSRSEFDLHNEIVDASNKNQPQFESNDWVMIFLFTVAFGLVAYILFSSFLSFKERHD